MSNSKHILLVEDEMDIRLIIHLMLHLKKCHVDFAEDGQTAVRMACNKQYDGILMDIGLPKLNGIDACFAIRQFEARSCPFRNTPIVAIMESAQSDEINKCIAAGMNTFLFKPITSDELDRIINESY